MIQEEMTKDKTNTEQPDALIFDMDGTLWDGVESYAQGFNDFFEINNINRKISKDDIKQFMGLEENEFLESTLPELSPLDRKNAYNQIIEYQYKRIESDGGLMYDGVKEGLFSLSKKYKLFIVSNCPEFTIDYFMRWAKITDLIVDSYAHGKNYKSKYQNIKYLIEKHNLTNPFYVGDTESDRKQSKLVSIPFVLVEYGFGTSDDYDLKFKSFAQLTEYFIKLI